MTLDQIQKVLALSGCVLPVESRSSRFINSLSKYIGDLPEEQSDYLDRLVYYYKKQISLQSWVSTPDGKIILSVWIYEGHKKVIQLLKKHILLEFNAILKG